VISTGDTIRFNQSPPPRSDHVSEPNFPDGYNVLASFYDELGEQDKRLQFALLAAHLRPNLPADAWLDLAEMCATAGKPQQAIACYAKGDG